MLPLIKTTILITVTILSLLTIENNQTGLDKELEKVRDFVSELEDKMKRSNYNTNWYKQKTKVDCLERLIKK